MDIIVSPGQVKSFLKINISRKRTNLWHQTIAATQTHHEMEHGATTMTTQTQLNLHGVSASCCNVVRFRFELKYIF